MLWLSRKNNNLKEYSMSNFWDSIIASSKTEDVAVVEQSDFWTSVALGLKAKSAKQSKGTVVKSTVKKSKAVAKAEKVYETIEGLIVPVEDCTHHWTIPSDSAWAIGVCKDCKGEQWFSNRFIEDNIFNDSLTTPVPIEVQKDITAALNTEVA